MPIIGIVCKLKRPLKPIPWPFLCFFHHKSINHSDKYGEINSDKNLLPKDGKHGLG